MQKKKSRDLEKKWSLELMITDSPFNNNNLSSW